MTSKDNAFNVLVVLALLLLVLLFLAEYKIYRLEQKVYYQSLTISECDSLIFNLIDGYPTHYGEVQPE